MKENINVDERKETIKDFFKKLHLQRRKWRHDSRNAICWSFYGLKLLTKVKFNKCTPII
jgi:hypothetical protein